MFNKIYLTIILSCIYIVNNNVLEVPLKFIHINGVSKYKNIKIKSTDNSKNKTLNNKKIFIHNGKAEINSDFLFLANVKIGPNEQEFNLVLDTGSSLLWVQRNGTFGNNTIKHYYIPFFNSTSKNLSEYYEIIYGTGSSKGYYFTDNFKYINDKEFNVKFGVAEETNFEVENGDGIIGLAHYYKDEQLSFIHMLKKYGVTDSINFSFKFDLDNGYDGKLFIGNHKDFSSDDTVTCPLLNFLYEEARIFWGCEVSGFSIKNADNEIKSSRSYNMIFDTGTNMVILPKNYFYDIKSKLNKFGCIPYSEENDENGENDIQIKCNDINNLPEFRFQINGNTLGIPYYIGFYSIIGDNNNYYSNIIFSDSTFPIIGVPFFLTFHTLFDKNKEKLHFYPEFSDTIEKDSNSSLIIILIIFTIIIGLILGYLIYRYIARRRMQNNIDSVFPSSNYNDNYNRLL